MDRKLPEVKLTANDFSENRITKTDIMKNVAKKLSPLLPKIGKADERAEAVLTALRDELGAYVTSRERQIIKNCLTLMAAPKSLKIEVVDGRGKNAPIIQKKAAHFLNSDKDTIQRAAKSVRNIQGTNRAERSGLQKHKDEARKQFYIHLRRMLGDPREREEILQVLRDKKILD